MKAALALMTLLLAGCASLRPDAGFSDVAVHEHTVAFAFSGVDELWARMVRSSAPLVMLRERLGEQVWSDRAQVARAFLLREIGDGPSALSTTALLGVARRS